jgi:hypothetical protein
MAGTASSRLSALSPIRDGAYTKALLDVAERCGVRRIVSLGALLAGAPHTRPVRVTA